jgi:hypothetical protein
VNRQPVSGHRAANERAIARAQRSFVFDRRSPFLQRVADYVSKGSRRYLTGSVSSVEQGLQLEDKFRRLFDVNLPRWTRSRARKEGIASAVLLFWRPDLTRPELFWIVLATSGAFPVQDTSQRWKCADECPISVDGFELIRWPKRGLSRPVWSWRLPNAQFRALTRTIGELVRQRRHRDLWELARDVGDYPGFAPIRAQLLEARKRIPEELRRKLGALRLFRPRGIRYLSRLKNSGAPLQAVRLSASQPIQLRQNKKTKGQDPATQHQEIPMHADSRSLMSRSPHAGSPPGA